MDPNCRKVELNSYNWSDLELISLQWANEGIDLVLTFLEPTKDESVSKSRVLQCSWASGLKLSISTPPNTGGSLTCVEARVTLTEQNQLNFECVLSPSGNFEFVSNDIEVSFHNI